MFQTVVVHLARGDINYHEYRAATASKQVKASILSDPLEHDKHDGLAAQTVDVRFLGIGS